jgi:hypothetical protein
MDKNQTVPKTTDVKTVSKAETKMGEINVEDRFFLLALLSVGYTPYTAIAELGDNGLDAKATIIEIGYDPKTGLLVVTDNGTGMSLSDLIRGMNMGADRAYDATDVGYFGVGMKSSILNLLNLDDENSFAEILTNNGSETTKILWNPSKSPKKYEFGTPSPNAKKGTKITIHNSKKFLIGVLKRNLAVMFYPALRTDSVTILINGEPLIGNDPLYRDREKTLTNFVDATVKGHTIRVEGVILNNEETNKHAWDIAKTSGDSGWSMAKSGLYINYGSRYIEMGGTLGMLSAHPSYNYTRIEFTLPKELTELFNVKFNKTHGLDLDPAVEKNEALSDLIQKIKGMFEWGRRNRKHKEDASETDKSELDDFQKQINDAANKARINGPETPKGDTPKDKPRDQEDDNDDKKGRGKDKEKRKTKIVKKEPFVFKFENFGSTVKFWHLEYVNNQFVVIINNGHVFYTDMWVNMNEAAKKSTMTLLASLAHAQYEITKVMDTTANGDQSEMYWDDFWSVVSMRLRHLIISR